MVPFGWWPETGTQEEQEQEGPAEFLGENHAIWAHAMNGSKRICFKCGNPITQFFMLRFCSTLAQSNFLPQTIDDLCCTSGACAAGP